MRFLCEPCSDGIGQDVSSHSQTCFVIAEDMFVVALLPLWLTPSATVAIRGSLLGLTSECDEIRGLGSAFDQQVHMIGHEAVRNNCKLM